MKNAQMSLQTPNDPLWYVLATEPQREATATAGLLGRNIPAYCPQEPKSVRVNRYKRRVVMRPMLTGYIFAGWNGSPEQWAHIHGVIGARRVLQVNDRPAPVPDAALNFLRQREAEGMTDFTKRKKRTLAVAIGDWVQVLDHFAFTGLFGCVVGLLDGKDRISLHVEMFGRQTLVSVSVNQVRAL